GEGFLDGPLLGPLFSRDVKTQTDETFSRHGWPDLLGTRYEAFVTAAAGAPPRERKGFVRASGSLPNTAMQAFVEAIDGHRIEEVSWANLYALMRTLSSHTLGSYLEALENERAQRFLRQIVAMPSESAKMFAQVELALPPRLA